MEDLIPNNSDIVGSGTNNLPVFCGWMQGKHNSRGKKIVVRINDEYYECFIVRKGKKWWGFRCSKGQREGCGFKLQVIPRIKDETHEDFWKRTNWDVIPGSTKEVHTCEQKSKAEITSRDNPPEIALLREYLEALNHANLNEVFKFQVFYEIAFKYGNIHSSRLNELFVEQHPESANNIPDL